MYRFYVATNGCDYNPGTMQAPFRTIERAKNAVRSLISTCLDAAVTVTVREGCYPTEDIVFDAADSGTKDYPITYEAEGKVVINGGTILKASDFMPLEKVERARLHGEARQKVVRIDLKKYGLTRAEWGEICAVGSHSTADKYDDAVISPLHCELYVNDIRMDMARYPNEGFLYTEEPIRQGNNIDWDSEEFKTVRNLDSDIRKIDKNTTERVKGWQSLEDVWIFGYPRYGWAGDTTPIVGVDTDKCHMETKYASGFGICEHAPYYFFNVFEEMDRPGEWYLDREQGILYLYPPKKLEEVEIYLSIKTQPLMIIEGATDLIIRGFTFTATRGNGVVIHGDRNIIDRCEIKNVSGKGIVVHGNQCVISNSSIHHTGYRGIEVNGGDRNTLTSSENIITNNHIYHIGEICRNYEPGVQVFGVNCIVSHNCIHDSAHMAVGFKGNDHIIEYNEIYNACQIADDSGAIYSGRDYSTSGNIIRYNYFHDLSSEAETQHIGIFAVYCDDNLGGTAIYGNIMHRCQCALLLHGGHDMIFKNNLIIDCCKRSQYSLRFHHYGNWKDLADPKGQHALYLQEVEWRNDIWQEKYPHLEEYLTWDPEKEQYMPHYCDISNNMIINHKKIDIRHFNCYEEHLRNRLVNNIEIADRNFVGIPDGDILDLSKNRIAKIIPGFEELPFNEMGCSFTM